MSKRLASEMEVARKALHRKSVEELSFGTVLSDAFDLALQPPSGTNTLEQLSYCIVLLRQLTTVVSQEHPPQHVVDLVHSRLAPALQPRGMLATLLRCELAHPVKPHPMRAAETLQATTRLVIALPPPATSTSSPGLLQALFDEVIQDGLSARPDLVALSIMIEGISTDQIPPGLLDRLLADMDVWDGINVRCNAIVSLLGRRRASAIGNDQEKDRVMFAPLIARLAEGGETSAQTITRYLLPSLFKIHPSSFPTLLELLDVQSEDGSGPDNFAGWVSVAAYGVSNGLVSLSALPLETVKEALVHEDPRVRILAFHLVAINKAVLDKQTLDLVKESLITNVAIPEAGGRTDMASAIFAFLAYFKELEHGVTRDEKRAKEPEKKAPLTIKVKNAADFHTWFLEDYITPSLCEGRAVPPFRVMFGLKVLRNYLEVYGDRVSQKVYTPRRIEILLACQASEYTETRLQARDIILQGPRPLPGYETLDKPTTRSLLAASRASLNHPRKTQAEAGQSALCLVFTTVVQAAGVDSAEAVSFVKGLIDILEQHVVKSEEDLATGIVEYPLHGPLSAIAEIVQSLHLKAASSQEVWQDTLHRLFALVDRVWILTSKVIALGSHEEGEGDATAGHEIARAYEVLGDGDDGDGGDEGLDHTNLLSGCWRAAKEASELLSMLMTVPLNGSPEQVVWTRENVNHAGVTYLTWMHEIRHRGTFSRIYSAFALVVEAVKAHKDLRDLVDSWLEVEFQTVAEGKLSTLRRSAALPFSFLALVAGDGALLDRTVDRLVNMARVSNSTTSDTTKVHALNCLKIVLLDAKQTRFLPRYLERAVTVALEAFASTNWSVRNVGLILFSTLANRSLNAGRSQETSNSRSALAGRQTLASWHSRYPSIIPYIGDYLRRSKKQGPGSLTEHSPLFPILIILRSLRWSPEGRIPADTLFPVVEPYLSSAEWQVREMASQALASLLSPVAAIERAKVMATRVSHDCAEFNTLHGRLLFLRRLFAGVIIWSDVEDEDKKFLEARMRDTLQEWATCKSAVIPKALLDLINTYAEETCPVSETLVPEAKRVAMVYLVPGAYSPGIDLLHESAADTVLLDATAKDAIGLLWPAVPEDAQLATLEYISSHPTLQIPDVLSAAVDLCSSPVGNAVLTKVFDTLGCWPSSAGADETIAGVTDLLWRTVQTTRCVPLREAALGALGRAVVADTVSADRIATLAERLEKASDENKSEPCRRSALQCLSPLGPLLFGPSEPLITPTAHASLHRTLLRLLQDDDEDIRIGASSIVQRGLGLARPIFQTHAVAQWWSWLERHVSTPEARAEWEPWLWTSVTDEAATESLLATLETPTQTVDVLFVEEQPNMFHDPIVDATYAASLLAKLTQPTSAPDTRERAAVAERKITAAIARSAPTPIDDAYEARRVLVQRREALRTSLGL